MKKGKLIGIFLCVTTISIGVATTAFASNAPKTLKAFFNNIKIYLDGKEVVTKSEPFIIDGVTYLPVRDIAEALDLEISWDKNNSIQITSKNYDDFIGKEKAKEIALKHAGIKESDAKNISVELDYNKGVFYYDVEFYNRNKEYDYNINAISGKIISYDNEINDDKPSTDKYITPSKAKEIAFKHAGVSVSDTKNLKISLDRDDNSYDIEFSNKGNTKYEYEIDALTGKILSYDKETNNNNNENTDKYISENKAKEIAFNHADVKTSDVKKLKINLDRNDKQYDIEFTVNNIEYEYEIDAVTGKILSYDKDYDNSNNSSNSYISQDKAKSIAFKHANVSSSSAKNIKIELDTDDGKSIYKVEFSSKTHEYEYEIDANSGKIIDHEIEEIDD